MVSKACHQLIVTALVAGIMLVITCRAGAAVIAATSFEHETPGGRHSDAATDGRVLPLGVWVDTTNAGGGLVDSTADSAVAGDLGFDLWWRNTREQLGLSDGNLIGVTYLTASVGTPDATVRGYQFDKPKGTAQLRFDPVSLSGHGGVTVAASFYISESSYSASAATRDFLSIEAATDVGTFTLINSVTDPNGPDIDNLGLEAAWHRRSVAIPDTATTVALFVTVDNDSTNKRFYLDDVLFTAMPEPAALVLFGLGNTLLAAGYRNRSSAKPPAGIGGSAVTGM